MAKHKGITQVDVGLGSRQYPVLIGRDYLSQTPLLASFVTSKQVLIVSNQVVAPLYLEELRLALSAKQCDEVVLEDGESTKNQQSLFAIYDALIQKRHHRDTTIIALGGGVVGDMAGFAASTYQRGVNLIHVPTTLLAQVDASIGGKTAINHPQGKNLIGCFYQPKAVFIELKFLETLPAREFKAGLAEIIKYAILVGGEFLNQLCLALKQGLRANSQELPWIIEQCCRIKAQYVEADERENGLRALLNLGHTFAHALEVYTNYQRWLHGEAVAIGLYCAAILSYKLQFIDKSVVSEIKHLLQSAGLPYQMPEDLDLKQLIALMSLDKKIKDDSLRFVLIKELGDCCLYASVSKECLYESLITAVQGE